MKNEIKVSIIIPVYNTEQYLRQCLDSVINQTFKNIEVIIINDGSTDGSLNIINEYKENYSYIKVINQTNKGYSKVRNVGLKIASGDYIGFVDSDDFIEKNMFEKLVNKAIDTNADIVSCNYYMIYKKGKKEISIALNNTPQIKILAQSQFSFTGAEILLLDEAFVWNRIYKRDFLEKNNIQFDENICFMEDTLFHRIALICSEKVVYIRDILYFYRIKRKGAQTTFTDYRNFSTFVISDKLFSLINNKRFVNVLPWMRYLMIGLLCLGYERIENKYKKKYFIKIYKYLKKYDMKENIKDIFSIYRKIRKRYFMCMRYYVLKILYPIIIKLALNKKFFMFNVFIELKKLLREILFYCIKVFYGRKYL